MEKKFCPFVNGICRDDCVFKKKDLFIRDEGVYSCLIATRLLRTNDILHNDLTAILELLNKN